MPSCVLCKSSKTDDIRYGEFLQKGKVAVHTFCLYLTSNLVQGGDDDEGFLGFLLPDIRNEERRISRLVCCYCNKAYANIGCCGKTCRRTFHMICGMENGALNQFANTFQSFCDRHIWRQTKQPRARPSDDELCSICYESIWEEAADYEGTGPLKTGAPSRKRFSRVEMLRAPCCENGWFHKYCLQRFAKNAGYFFKCPLCNDKETICQTLPYQGVFIPSSDAAWEAVPHAYEELLERPKSCSAPSCHNRRGREHCSDSDPLVICSLCGSVAMHKACMRSGSSFQCDECVNILKTDSGHESGLHQHNSDGDDDEDEDIEIDVCNTDPGSDSESDDIRSPRKGSGRKSLRIASSDDEGSDVDPCEDFNYCMQKKLAESMVSNGSGPEKTASGKPFGTRLDWEAHDEEEEDVVMRPPAKNAKSRRISDSESSSSNGYETASADPLDEFNAGMQQHEKRGTAATLEISCIARRTRRRSSTAHSTTPGHSPGGEHSQRRPATMFSDESSNSSDASSDYFTAMPSNASSQQRSTALDISCIANRTRRRSINKEKRVAHPVSGNEESSSSSSTGSSLPWDRRRSDNSLDSELTSNDFTDSCNGTSEASLSPPPKANPLDVSSVATRIKRRKLKLDDIGEEEEFSGAGTPTRVLTSLGGKRNSAGRADTPTVKPYRPGPRSSKEKLPRSNSRDQKDLRRIEERENTTPLRNFSKSYNFLVSRP